MTEVVSKRGLFSSSFLKNKSKHNLRKKEKRKEKHAGSTGKESTSMYLFSVR